MSFTPGQEVKLAVDLPDADASYLRAGLTGTVVAYLSPQIRQSAAWPRETYLVRLECHTPDSPGRILDREALTAL